MTCDALAYTGPGGQLGLLLTLAIASLLAGGIILLMTRRRGRRAVLAVLVLVTGASLSIAVQASAPAAASDCLTADNSLTITQTSTMKGLAPGIPPAAITGIVSNNGPDSTYVTAIDVEIAVVVTDPGSAQGQCDAGDYVVLNSRMPVGTTLAPGASITFAGASIGFASKPVNQDACQGATIQLLYTANPL